MSRKVILFWYETSATKHFLTEFLREKGFEVLIAERDSQCYKHLARRHIDLVLLDIQRDDLTGLILTKRIRSLSKHRHTPIISLTQNSIMPLPENIAWDCDEFISKPIDKNLLLHKMKSLMERYFY